MSNLFVRIETLTGPPIKIKDTELRVRSQVLHLRLPVISGGLIWNRPVAMIVRTPGGQDHILPIRDMTRIAMLVLAGLCFASIFLFMFYRRKIT